MATDLSAATQAAEGWLLHSGIQRTDPTLGIPGGVHAWFDRARGTYSFLYSEITGYAITSLVHLYSRQADPFYLERAELAADWLIKEAMEPNGAVLCRQHNTGWDRTLYAFDAGMGMNGLVNLYKRTAKPRHLAAARTIGDWLTASMQRSDGGFFSKFNSETQEPHNTGEKWSTISGSFLVKLAIGLLNLDDATGDGRYAEAAKKLCEWGLALQHEDGRFPTTQSSSITFVHPHCYTAEGLLVAGQVLGERSWAEAAARAVAWIAPRQLADGGFPAYFINGEFVPAASPDITAQVLRLWLLLPPNLQVAIPLDPGAAIEAVARAQCQDGPAQEAGGFSAGAAWFFGEPADHTGEHVNSWVTMFTLQTLALAMPSQAPFDPFLVV